MADSSGAILMVMMMVMMMLCIPSVGMLLLWLANSNGSGQSDTASGDSTVDSTTDDSTAQKSSSSVPQGKVYIASHSCDKKSGKWHRLLSLRSDNTLKPIMFCKREGDLTVWNLKKVDTYYYRIQNDKTGQYLFARKDNWLPTMVSSPKDSRADWVIKKQDDGSFAILNRNTRQYLLIYDNVCDSFDSEGINLRVEKLTLEGDDKTTVPDKARWKIGSASSGWSKYIPSSDTC